MQNNTGANTLNEQCVMYGMQKPIHLDPKPHSRTFAIKEANRIHLCDINIFRMIMDMSEMFLHTMSGS